MKLKQIIFLTILTSVTNLSYGQSESAKKELNSNQISLTKDYPFTVLKVDDKLLEFNSGKNEKLDLDLIDPNSIESISVLKGKDATDKYGSKGLGGAIVITFKDFNSISKELQTKFIDSNKK